MGRACWDADGSAPGCAVWPIPHPIFHALPGGGTVRLANVAPSIKRKPNEVNQITQGIRVSNSRSKTYRTRYSGAGTVWELGLNDDSERDHKHWSPDTPRVS